MPKKVTGSIFWGRKIFFEKLGILRIWKYLFFWLFAPQPLPITEFGVHYRKVREKSIQNKKKVTCLYLNFLSYILFYLLIFCWISHFPPLSTHIFRFLFCRFLRLLPGCYFGSWLRVWRGILEKFFFGYFGGRNFFFEKKLIKNNYSYILCMFH